MSGTSQGAATGVQSVHRALDLVDHVAAAGGVLSLAELAAIAKLPMPTIHRLLRTLIHHGWMRQLPDRRYALGSRLVPLGTVAASLIGPAAEALLAGLVAHTGESANLAVLSGDTAEYVAQSPSPHQMRMFTEVGRRVELHCTGVGKAILATLSDDEALAIVRRRGMSPHTDHTLTDETALLADLVLTRARGYALDEQEQELGVRCVAAAVHDGDRPWGAVSVSGPLPRMTDELVAAAVPRLHDVAEQIARTTVSPAQPARARKEHAG